ncbi:TolC family protein, partial [bacterium]|nr:TolC family protein [bacterium]
MSQHRLHLAGRAAIVAMLFMAVATSAETPLEPTVEKPRSRPPAAAKPSPHPLTLQDAIHRALQHNLALAAARLSPPQAATVVVEERAAFDPAAFGEFNRRKANQQARSALFGEREQNGAAAVGLRKRFPLGTEAEAFYGLEKDWNDAPFATTNPAYHQGHGAQLVQPLLKGFGIRVNTAAIATARNDQRIALAALHDAALQTIAETVRMYWELAYAHGNRTFLLDSLERTRNLQRDIEVRVRAEVLGGRDPSVAQAAAGVAVAQEAIIAADDAIRDVEDSLKVLTDLGADDALWDAVLLPPTPPPPPPPP